MSHLYLKGTLSLCLSAAFVLALVLLLSTQATAECSGTCPPPTVGDWQIGADTRLANETIVLDGDLVVQSGRTLTLENVTIVMNQSFSSYIWTQSSAQLLMSNTDIFLGQTYYFIQINGSANIDNSSIQGANRTIFGIGSDPSSRVNNTQFLDSAHEALRLSASITVANSTLRASGDDGIRVMEGSPRIENSLITENEDNGIVCVSGSPTIVGSTISDNAGIGIYSSGGSPIIEGSIISDNLNDGLNFNSSSPAISGNTISGNGDKAIVLMNTLSAVIEGNSISGYEKGIQLENATAVLENSTLVSVTSISDFLLFDGSQLHAINTTFNGDNVYFHEAASELRVSWILDINCLDEGGSSVEAWLDITDKASVLRYSRHLASGSADGILLSEYTETKLGRTDFSPYSLEATGSGLTIEASHALQASTDITIPVWNVPPTTPSPLFPVDSALVVSLTVEFQWQAATDSDQWDSIASYTLEYTTDSAFLTGITPVGITGTAHTTILSDSQTYYWRVSAVDTHGAASTPSSIHSFDVEVGQGANLNPPTIKDTLQASLSIAVDVPYPLDLAPHLEDDGGVTALFISVDRSWVSVENLTLTFLSDTVRTETVTITVTDGLSAVQATIDVTVSLNKPPVLNTTAWKALNLTFDEDTTYMLDLTDYFTDTDGTLSSSSATEGSNNITAERSSNSYAYDFTPKADWSGNETITFRVFDSGGAFTEATLTVRIAEVNDLPVLIDSLPSLTIQEGGTWSLDLDYYFRDVDGPSLTFRCSNPHITIDPRTNIAQWSPQDGTDKLSGVTFTLDDGIAQVTSDPIDITVSRPTNIFSNPLIWLLLIGSIVGEVGAFLLYRKLKYAYSIGEVFLLDKYGLLMLHIPINTEIVIDEDIMGGMLTSVQQFVGDSLGKGGEEGGDDHLGKLEYGDLQICIESGNYVNLATVILGHAAQSLYKRMERTIEQIEKGNEKLLEDWGGYTENVAYAGDIIRDVLLDKKERKTSDRAKKKKQSPSAVAASEPEKGSMETQKQSSKPREPLAKEATPLPPPEDEMPPPPDDEDYPPPPPGDDGGYYPPPP